MNNNQKSTESINSDSKDIIDVTDTYYIKSNRIKHLLYKFNNYEIDVVLDDNGRFIGIEGIQIFKTFIDAANLPEIKGKSAEELIEEFFNEQDD